MQGKKIEKEYMYLTELDTALWASLGLDPTYIGCYFWSNNESRDSIDCFYGCLEGPSIFLESFILLRILICVCGEGEIVAVMAWLVPPPCPV